MRHGESREGSGASVRDYSSCTNDCFEREAIEKDVVLRIHILGQGEK